MSCFGANPPLNQNTFASNVDEYSFSTTWFNGDQDLCSEGYMYVIDARSGAETVNFSNQGLVQESCATGDICTVVFARGFNRACNELNSLRTVQRELTISF